MIKTKKDLKEYIKADKLRNNSGNINRSHFSSIKNAVKCLLGIHNENYYVIKYLKTLRLYEYYLNNASKNFHCYLLSKYYSMMHKKQSNIYRIYIGPNMVGKGLYIPHFAGGIICNCLTMGENCIISSGVVVGNKGGQNNRPSIGNNVELCIGCKVIGQVNIEDNAIVAPNSVVIKDVSYNSVVSGIPAKIIKVKS